MNKEPNVRAPVERMLDGRRWSESKKHGCPTCNGVDPKSCMRCRGKTRMSDWVNTSNGWTPNDKGNLTRNKPQEFRNMTDLSETQNPKNGTAVSGQVDPLVIKRIYLHPGFVYSKTDGDRHFVGARELAKLYGVDYSKCYLVPHGKPLLGHRNDSEEIHLYPKYNGNYTHEDL